MQEIFQRRSVRSFLDIWQALAPLQEREDAARKVLGLPDNVRPFAFISVGYPGKVPAAEDRFDPNRIHNERW